MASASPILAATISAAPRAAAALASAAPGLLHSYGLSAPSITPAPVPSALETTAPASAAAFEREIARLPEQKADEITRELLEAAHDSTKTLRDERIRQARSTFNAAIALVVIGVLIIFVGVALILLRQTTTSGSLTAALGAVTEVISAILFRFHNQTNSKLDELGRELSVIESARIAMMLIEKIEDPAKRDDAIRDAARDLRARGNVTTV